MKLPQRQLRMGQDPADPLIVAAVCVIFAVIAGANLYARHRCR